MKYGLLIGVAALFLAAGGSAEVSGVSAPAALNTETRVSLAAVEDQSLNTNDFDEDWSNWTSLNTKRILGMLMILR